MERKRRCKSLDNLAGTAVELSPTTPYLMEIETPPVSSNELKAFIDTLESADCVVKRYDSQEKEKTHFERASRSKVRMIEPAKLSLENHRDFQH